MQNELEILEGGSRGLDEIIPYHLLEDLRKITKNVQTE
jgi:hypothetical protein